MELQHVRGRTWVAVASTALLVVYRVTDTDIILIDTGYAKLDRAGLTALIDSSGFHLRGVICSHAHFDHSGNVRYLQQRYQALRAGAWSEESLMRMLDECEAAVFVSGAYERDYARWPQTAHWDGMQDLGDFRAYVKARLAAMDAFMQDLQNGVGAAQPG